jgi:hypothetical protein
MSRPAESPVPAARDSAPPPRAESFDAPDSVVSFRCHGAMIWPTYVVSFLKPDLAISLKPA